MIIIQPIKNNNNNKNNIYIIILIYILYFKYLYTIILYIMPCLYLNFQQSVSVPADIQIGSGTSNLTGMPLYGLYDYSQGGMIYLASELTAVANKQITAIEFQYNGWTTSYTANNQVIKLGHISGSAFPSTADVDYNDVNGGVPPTLTTCKTGFSTLNFSPNIGSGGFIKHTFTTNFTYNGTSNLLISWENVDGSWASGYGWAEGFSTSGKRHARWFADNNYPTSSSSSGGNSVPNIIIHYQ